MRLPAPNLDDRRFQELVDDAKRHVQKQCPEWTDHNVHDPGVTLIETFAWMTDQILYRLNQVPERMYIAFLDLLGVQLFPPTAAHADVTFWLSGPRPHDVEISLGTEVATAASTAPPVVFTVREALTIPPCEHTVVATESGGTATLRTNELIAETGVTAFSGHPVPDDALLVGLSTAVPRCAVELRLECPTEGSGVKPDDAPIVWEAWTGERWDICQVDEDTTGGLNRNGAVVLHVPVGHTQSAVAGATAAWLRCRLVAARPAQATYRVPPRVMSVEASTVGGTTSAIHARHITNEIVGEAEGVAGQRVTATNAPVLLTEGPVALSVSTHDGWEEWLAVDTFADSSDDDRHFTLDATNGEIQFGPGVREEDGTLRTYGATPLKGASIRLDSYWSGGGRHGNLARGTISVLRTGNADVHRVENRQAAQGGVDGETVEDAKRRGSALLRTRSRAVTAEDYAELARQSAPEAARIEVFTSERGEEAGGVRVLVVPQVRPDHLGAVAFGELKPEQELVERIRRDLDERRTVGVRLAVEPPLYQGITVVARLRSSVRADPAVVKDEALRSLYRLLDPVEGGSLGTGWPFGRALDQGSIHAALLRVSGLEYVEVVEMFPADPVSGVRGEPTGRLEIGPRELLYSYDHQVQVVPVDVRA